jgi:hypothetical protein
MITLDPWQRITKFNWPVGIADYAICYARVVPMYTCLGGYSMVLDPFLRELEGWEETTSVGDWDGGPLPYGSSHRSFPELSNGLFRATRLPTASELDQVYIWHVGRSHAWGISDQIIVNVRKLRIDYPQHETFRIHLAAIPHAAKENGDGDTVSPSPIVPSPRPPLDVIVGIRTFEDDGAGTGMFDFPKVDVIDPFGNKRSFTGMIADYPGGKLTASFERLAPSAKLSHYGFTYQVRGISWRIDWQNPSHSILAAGPISVGPA